MKEKEIINLIKSDDALKANDKLWNSIECKIRTVESPSVNPGKKHTLFFRLGIASSFIAAALLMVFILPVLNKPSVNNPAEQTTANNQNNLTHGNPSATFNGPAMFAYYRYNGKYYRAEYPNSNVDNQVSKDFAEIQNKIDKRLYKDFYEISGVDPAKSIAYFNGRYYYKLDYAFDDSVYFTGKPYLINAIEGPDANVDSKTGKPNFITGKYLGKAGSYDAYELPGSDPLKKIILESTDKNYFVAYQLLSTVVLNGTTYEVQPDINAISAEEKGKYLGKAGPYSAYAINDGNSPQSIILHINKNEEVPAYPITETSDKNIPKSMYGSPFDSMYPIDADIQWNHAIYWISGSFNYIKDQSSLISKIGKELGSYSSGFASNKVNYYLYEIKGVDPSSSIAVKNNEVYLRYDFLLSSTVKFNGKDYEISLTGSDGVRGNQIGLSGSNKVYEVKGIDPSKEIIVLINGTTWTAYSK